MRNDAGVREGDEISMFYDPMISKLCAWGDDPGRPRSTAWPGRWRTSTSRALGHNIPFLSAVMDQDRFRVGAPATSYIADEFPDGFHGLPPTTSSATA